MIGIRKMYICKKNKQVVSMPMLLSLVSEAEKTSPNTSNTQGRDNHKETTAVPQTGKFQKWGILPVMLDLHATRDFDECTLKPLPPYN